MAIFKGAAVAIVTPFLDNGEINYPNFLSFWITRLKMAQTPSSSAGTTGESSTLSHEEHLEAIRFTVEHVKKRVPGYRREPVPIVRRPPFICPGRQKNTARTHCWCDSLL